MSFYTSLTGLNGAQADIAAISNNVANVGTTGFKLSRAEFGDIFATSPLQNASGAVGSGTILKSVKQQFTQGNIASTQNSLDMAISGQGFFTMKPSLTSTQSVYTRNGAFTVNNNNYVVDSQGQFLQVFPVNSDGSVIATGIQSAKNLQLPSTSGSPNATSSIQLGLNLPADAAIIPDSSTYSVSNPYKFDHTNSSTYNQSTSITIYDSLGNPTIATIYYVKTANATNVSPSNKWQTHVFVGDNEVTPSLITSKDDQSKTLYINKFGQTTTDPTKLDSSFVANQPSPLYYQDQQTKKVASTAAEVVGAIQNSVGFDFGDTDANKVDVVTDPNQYSTTREGGATGLTSPFWGKDMFTISVDGSQPQSINVNAGSYTGEELAAEMTRAVNSKFSNANSFRITDTYRDVGGSVIPGNDVLNVALSKVSADGTNVPLNPPLEIDLLGTAGSAGTPQVDGVSQQLNYQDLSRDQLIQLAQSKVNDALNSRHNEFGKPANWVGSSNPPIKVGYDVSSRSLTFTVDPGQLGQDASLPQNRYNNVQVYNPTSTVNDLGIPAQSGSNLTAIRANSSWTGEAVLPSGPALTNSADQRTGIEITYNKDTRQFVFSSGTTGEASSIRVGRSSLTTINDVQPQINSFDFTNLKLAANQSISLEIDGQQFSYTTPTAVTGSADVPGTSISVNTFLNKLQQSLPVTFSPVTETSVGNTTTADTQAVSLYGNILNNDKFTFQIQRDVDSATSGESPITLTTASLAGLTSSSSPAERVAAVKSAINAAISLYNSTATNDIAVTADIDPNNSSSIRFTYANKGAVGSLATITQSTRGTVDGSGQTPIDYTAQTVVSSPAIVTSSGNAKAAEVQELTLQAAAVGDTVKIAVGDKYTVSVPRADGSVATVTATATAASVAGLVAGLNAAFSTGTDNGLVTFKEDGTTNSIIMTYANQGAISGTFSMKQASTAVAGTQTQIRPDSIGPISLSVSNARLLVNGNPDGTAFRLNVQANGVVEPLEPQGAAGSKTQAGKQIGTTSATNSSSPAMYLGNNDLLGIGAAKTVQAVAGTGLVSTAAMATGTTAITPMSQTFLLNQSLGENNMTFTVDGITGTIELPIRAYTGDTFAAAIQQRVNQIQDPVTGRVVSGVTVKFDSSNNRLIFTSGTTGSTSQINVVGPANFGLSQVTQTQGTVPSITVLEQATDTLGNKLYVDQYGNTTTTPPSTKLQSWSPLYLTPGQLTFDTAGKLISPKQGVVYSPFDPANGSNPLNLTIDYGKYSTQNTRPFSVQSLTQDGYPSGSLNGLNVDASGTVTASYTNGQTTALGKVMIANFANNNGLKQIGNANYVATSVSGQASLGQAGADGFGSIQAGALERSNVDITAELVNLITAQRNFQANAKAIETDTTLTNTIIQIRG